MHEPPVAEFVAQFPPVSPEPTTPMSDDDEDEDEDLRQSLGINSDSDEALQICVMEGFFKTEIHFLNFPGSGFPHFQNCPVSGAYRRTILEIESDRTSTKIICMEN